MRYKKSFHILSSIMSPRGQSDLKKIDHCTIKIEVDFVESLEYIRNDQKRESKHVGVLYIHGCGYTIFFSTAFKNEVI